MLSGREYRPEETVAEARIREWSKGAKGGCDASGGQRTKPAYSGEDKAAAGAKGQNEWLEKPAGHAGGEVSRKRAGDDARRGLQRRMASRVKECTKKRL